MHEMGITDANGFICPYPHADATPERRLWIDDFMLALVHPNAHNWQRKLPRWQAAQRLLSAEYFRIKNPREHAGFVFLSRMAAKK